MTSNPIVLWHQLAQFTTTHPWWGISWAILIVIVTIPEAYSEFLQGRIIWRARAALKIPLDAYAIDVGTFLATLLYGVVVGSRPRYNHSTTLEKS